MADVKAFAVPTKTVTDISGVRVKVTLVDHPHVSKKGTVLSESKTNYRIQLDGVKTPQTIAKSSVTRLRGRRPKVA